MHVQHNYMRVYRRKSGLKQSDIVSLLRLSGRGSVGLWERGLRKAPLDIPLAYHLLFDVPLESLFHRQRHRVRGALHERIGSRIEELKTLSPTPHNADRIKFLERALTRLAAAQI